MLKSTYQRVERIDSFLGAIDVLYVVRIRVVEECVEVCKTLDSARHKIKLTQWLP